MSTRAWRQKGIDSVVGLLNNISVDSFIYSTRAWRQKGIDSVQANLSSGLATKLNISDTALMLTPYLRKADTITLSNRIDARVKYTDTATMLSPYLRKADTTTLSNRINLKLNIADTATMLSPYSKLKSVGLSMPSAFNVANSPLTSDGTLAVTGAGNATQYVRGDGVLATLPTNGSGGGASVSYYLNGSVNQGTIGGVTYYEMNRTPIIGAGTDFVRNSNGYIASFLTDANDPALLNIPAGNWNFETYFQASSGGGSPTFYIELYKYDGTTFTLIASNSGSPKLINDGTNIEAYFSALAVPQTTLTLTDRLAIRIYVNTSGRTITLHTENGHLCQVITTFTTGLTALNGLTSQVQYFAIGTTGTDFNISSVTDTHTFNLPTASATNRGALSSANWTTFNNKQNAITLTTSGTSGASTLVGSTLNIPQYQGVLTNPITGTGVGTSSGGRVPYFTGTTTQVGSDNLWWDNTNARLGIGTTTPANTLDVIGQIKGNSVKTQFGFETTGVDFAIWNSLNNTGYIRFITQTSNAQAERMRVFNNGNIAINTTTDAGFRLDVNGTARVQDALTVSKNQNSSTILTISNTTAGSGSQANITLTSDATAGNGQLFKYSSSRPAYKTIGSSDLGFYNGTGGNISILNDFASGNINFTAGANSNAQLTIASSGNITQSVNQNAATTLKVSNTTSGTASESILLLTSNNGNYQFGKTSSTKTAFKTISANDGYIFNDVSGNISILNNFTTGNINFAAGGSSTAQATLATTGNLLIGTTTDVASSKLTVESTTQGFLPPRMTTAQRDLIATPAAGLVIYNTSTNKHQGYNGTTWNDFY